MLARAWWFNWRVGWPERQRGLHYWLGFEYALLLTTLDARAGGRWLDVDSGAPAAIRPAQFNGFTAVSALERHRRPRRPATRSPSARGSRAPTGWGW